VFLYDIYILFNVFCVNLAKVLVDGEYSELIRSSCGCIFFRYCKQRIETQI